MRQIVYRSSAVGRITASDWVSLLAKSRLNNRQAFLTGLLLFDGHEFLQVLEGEADAIEHTFARISGDTRHRQVRVLSDRVVSGREFGNWAMAGNDGDDNFGSKVVALTEQVSCASLKSKFRNFADYA